MKANRSVAMTDGGSARAASGESIAARCNCTQSKPVTIDENTVACEVCKGWIAARIPDLVAWCKFRERFGGPPGKEP